MGVLDTSYTFDNNDTITSTKMNNIIDQSSFTSGAIFGDTLELISGQLKVRALGITSSELGANAVTTAKITNNNVTSPKLETNISIAGTLSVAGTSTHTGESIFTNGLVVGTASFPVPSGSGSLYAARAWGRFNATSSGGTLVNGRSIASISRTSIGKYVITFTSGTIPTNPAILVTSSAINFITASSSSSVNLSFLNTSGTIVDPLTIHIAVFA